MLVHVTFVPRLNFEQQKKSVAFLSAVESSGRRFEKKTCDKKVT